MTAVVTVGLEQLRSVSVIYLTAAASGVRLDLFLYRLLYLLFYLFGPVVLVDRQYSYT